MGGHGKIGRGYELRFHDLIGIFLLLNLLLAILLYSVQKLRGLGREEE